MRDMHSLAFNRLTPISCIGRTQKVLKLTFSCIFWLSHPQGWHPSREGDFSSVLLLWSVSHDLGNQKGCSKHLLTNNLPLSTFILFLFSELSFLLNKLAEDPDLNQYIKNQYYSYQDIRRIVYRYQKNHQAIVEKKILQTAPSISQMIRLLSPSVKKYIDLKYEILDHVKSKGTVIQSEIRRNKRRYQRISVELINKMTDELDSEGLIRKSKYSGRIYLTYLG
jgi:hypothetical protein